MVFRLRKGPSGPPATESSDSEPLTTARWVDPATQVSPSLQNGSENAPFSTIGAALADLEAASAELAFAEGALYLAPGNYGSEAVSWTTSTLTSLTIIGLGAVVDFASFEMIHLGLDSSYLRLIDVGSNEGFGPVVTATNEASFLSVEGCILSGITGTTPVVVQTSFITGGITAASVEASSSSFSGDIVVPGACSLTECQSNTTADIDAGFIRLQGCFWNGNLSCSGEVQLIDTYTTSGFPGGTSNILTTGPLEIWNSRLSGNVTSLDLSIDTVSYQAALAAGLTFTITNPIAIVDPPISAALAIAVPTVAAGAVDYTNRTLIGTSLENVFNGANEPVIVSPEEDLVAAGPGGGFLNARLSAANTLRCAFIGPLSSATVTFTVSRAR